jgi:hypothetical protein
MWSEWGKADNVKWLLTAALIPITLGYLSNRYQAAQTERQANDARLRLYTELLSKREDADTTVRRGIFDKVLETYLKPESQDVQAKLVALELLALNFNDSLDLSPLFWQLDKHIQRVQDRGGLHAHLERIANGVKDRQISALESVGEKAEGSIVFGDSRYSAPIKNKELSIANSDPLAVQKRMKQRFTVDIIDHDTVGRRILVRVIRDGGESVFWVDMFDFPLVNFVRLSKAERFSVVLKRYRPDDAQITLIYFPSSRSGVKDKPFLDELISDLLRKPD